MSDFVHLHTHTEFSLLDGLSSPRELANYAVELGMDALAVTDHGVMFGVVDFYQACQAAGIKPIIGIEAYVARTSRHSRNRDDGKPYHIVLLAQNQTGYQNLLELASLAQLEGFYYTISNVFCGLQNFLLVAFRSSKPCILRVFEEKSAYSLQNPCFWQERFHVFF